jgi:hypothetical protein
MNPGKQVEMFFKNEEGRSPVEKAQEYLDNPNFLDIYRGYFEKYGNRNAGARGIVARINDEVGFPMTFWDSAKPDIINYKDTGQIEEYIKESLNKKAA